MRRHPAAPEILIGTTFAVIQHRHAAARLEKHGRKLAAGDAGAHTTSDAEQA